MNRLVKILFVLAITTMSYGAFAQQNVITESVHKYNVTAHTGNQYSWIVEKFSGGTWGAAPATEYSFVTSYTDNTVVANVVDQVDLSEVFILWKNAGNYRVILRERNHIGDGDCYDAAENEKIKLVDVSANNFTVGITAQAVTCAVTGNNTIEFTLLKTNGKDADWKFKYQVSLDGAPYGAEQEYTVDFASDANDYILPIVFDVPEGDTDCEIKVKLTFASDGYNTPASNLGTPIEVTATLHRLAATGEIQTD